MLVLIRLFLESLVALFRPRAALVAENLALRHQLGILLRSRPARLPLTSWDRALWAFVLHRFPAWRQSLVIVRPETVIAWHRQAFRLFWRWKSQAGRPRAHAEVRRLIREMASDNPTWGEKETEWHRFHAPQAPGNSHCTPTTPGNSHCIPAHPLGGSFREKVDFSNLNRRPDRIPVYAGYGLRLVPPASRTSGSCAAGRSWGRS
jgi:hypothetical protein